VIRSDVPVGVALSGGFDSSAIAALAAGKYPGTMHAFSVGYPGRPQSDERADAQALADHLGLPFHDIELSTDQMVAFFPELVYWRDDPIADISGFGYYAVMKVAREHNVPVVLQGQGGDELFWGYGWVQAALLQSERKFSSRGEGTLAALLKYLSLRLPRSRSRSELSQWIRDIAGMRSGLQSFRRDRAAHPNQLVFYDLVSDFCTSLQEVPTVFSQAFRDQLNGSSPTSLFTVPHGSSQLGVTLTRLICDTYLRENGITQGDRLSMASSIELRLPLVDHRLVETVIGLRKTNSDAQQPAKSWFRAAIGDLLPAWVAERPKRGFSPPVLEWHRALFSAYGEDLRAGFLQQQGVLNEKSAAELAAGPFPQQAISPMSFKALVLELWCRRMSN
jgi:asparagine synthase (glutamine-hydrolysing)